MQCESVNRMKNIIQNVWFHSDTGTKEVSENMKKIIINKFKRHNMDQTETEMHS